MGSNSVVLGHPKSTGILRVDGLSMRPPDFGCHSYCSRSETIHCWRLSMVGDCPIALNEAVIRGCL